MIENSTLRVGGNTLKVWFGSIIEKFGAYLNLFGTNYILKNKPRKIGRAHV